jgi:hypothetical protein
VPAEWASRSAALDDRGRPLGPSARSRNGAGMSRRPPTQKAGVPQRLSREAQPPVVEPSAAGAFCCGVPVVAVVDVFCFGAFLQSATT